MAFVRGIPGVVSGGSLIKAFVGVQSISRASSFMIKFMFYDKVSTP